MKFGETTRPHSPRPWPEGGKKGRVLPLWPQRWRMLAADERTPLWLPLPDARSDSRCLGHFITHRGRALYARALLRLCEWMPRARVLPEMDLPKSIRGILSFDMPVDPPWRAVIHIGAPGPDQRACVLYLSPDGEPLAFAKVATVPSADPVVGTEAQWLGRIGVHEGLAGQVPRMLAEGATLAGRCYFVTTPAPSTQHSARFTPAHARFVNALGRTHIDQRPFSSSPALRHLEAMLARLQPGIERQVGDALRTALADCVGCVGSWEGPFVMAHGDFVPSNIRAHSGRIFVFDWEHARAGANPLADLLHFHVVPRAASGRILSARAFAAALRAVAGRAREIYPEWRWPRPVVAGLGLAYLIEDLLRRSLIHRCFDRADPVVKNHWQLLQRRGSWLWPAPYALWA